MDPTPTTCLIAALHGRGYHMLADFPLRRDTTIGFRLYTNGGHILCLHLYANGGCDLYGHLTESPALDAIIAAIPTE